METKAAGSPERQIAQEDSRDSVQKASGSTTTELRIHKAEPSAERMDKLFPNRKHEDMTEGRTGPMGAPQSTSSDSQTVEETEDDLQESDEVECCFQMQSDRRRHPESIRLSSGLVQKSWHEIGKLPAESQSAILVKQEREPTGSGRSSCLLPEKYLNPCYDVAPYT